MLRNNLVILFVVIATSVSAQLHLDDPNYIYQNESKRILKSSEVEYLLTSKQHYSLKEEETKKGKFTVTLVPISNKEFRQTIRKKKKLVRDLKGQKMVDYSLKDENGNETTNHSFDASKVTVYNFWFTTCPHCIEEIPKLNEVVSKFSSNDVKFLAPTFNTHTQVAEFLKNNTFDYTILTSGKSLAQDLHIRSYPTHIIVDHEGTIKKVMIGSSNRVIRHLYKNIKHLLGHEIRVEKRIANH